MANSNSTDEKRAKGITLKEEFLRNPDCPIENFEILRQWTAHEFQLPFISDEKLFQFFYSCFYNIDNTKKCINSFYEIKTNAPEFYKNRDISDPELQSALQCTATFTLPVLVPEKNYRITYICVDDPDVNKFDFNKTVKLFFMAYDAELYFKGTARGHIIICDLKNCGFRHIMKAGLDGWKKIIRLTQEALPVRRKTMHILNTNYFIYKFAQVLKPFIAPEVFRTIHLHRPNELEEFYKFIPRECLPREYGGNLEPSIVYKKKFEEDLWQLRDFFNNDDKLILQK